MDEIQGIGRIINSTLLSVLIVILMLLLVIIMLVNLILIVQLVSPVKSIPPILVHWRSRLTERSVSFIMSSTEVSPAKSVVVKGFLYHIDSILTSTPILALASWDVSQHCHLIA